MRRRAVLVPVVALLLLGLAPLTSCGSDRQVVEIVVPKGTAEKIRSGQKIDVMPSTLKLRVGDTFRAVNKDTEDATVGPWIVKAGKTFEVHFGAPGTYEGVCALSDSERYLIEVT